MRRLPALAVLALAAVVPAALLAPAPARADDEIVIEAGRLRPALLRTTTAHRVTFVNRSGRIARVEFTDNPGSRREFEVPVQLWASFDRPGRHAYLVRLGNGKDAVVLRGVMEVARAGPSLDPPTCDSETLPGMRVMGPCIAW